MSYRHLNAAEREELAKGKCCGLSLRQLAAYLQRSPSTLSRELRRNGAAQKYQGYLAQAKAVRRRAAAPRPKRLDHPPLAKYVRQKLAAKWSPEQIAGRLPVDFPHDQRLRLSHETLYAWLWADKHQGGDFWTHLRQSHRRRRKRRGGKDLRGQIPGRVGIEKRPQSVENRRTFGHWESDTVEGVRKHGYLATHVERKSRYIFLLKLPHKSAAAFNRATLRRFLKLPKALRRSWTVDNGKEFAAFKKLEKLLGGHFYFARPYHAWERALNENFNGLVRQFFPKNMDLRKVPPKVIDKAERLLNTRPRKCLRFRTPAEVLCARQSVALQI
jgi:transposase, IS30 family